MIRGLLHWLGRTVVRAVGEWLAGSPGGPGAEDNLGAGI
jgi:hypothetical protein